jgi:hypothetical protein
MKQTRRNPARCQSKNYGLAEKSETLACRTLRVDTPTGTCVERGSCNGTPRFNNDILESEQNLETNKERRDSGKAGSAETRPHYTNRIHGH